MTPWRFTFGRQPRRRHQLGLGLVEVMLIIALLGGLTAFGFMELRERESTQSVRQEKALLAQADAALLTFVTINNRLPCPDTDRDGLEDCAAVAQKGWFPSKTLLFAGADSGVVVGQLRYLVQRSNASYDLTAVTDTWRPLKYTSTFADMQKSTASGGTYPSTILTLADFCERVKLATNAVATGVTPGMAQVTSSPARAVAYALAHPGRYGANGSGAGFDGVNASVGNSFEDPAKKTLLADYDDVVLERSFSSLQLTYNCESLAQSINTISLGLDVVAQVDVMRVANITSASIALATAVFSAGKSVASIIESGVEMGSDSSNAAADFAACVASLGVATNFCSAGPVHVSSSVLAGVSMALHSAAVIGNIAVVALAASAVAVADLSRPASSLSCPTVDVTAARDAAVTERDNAEAALQTLQNEIAQKQTALNDANTAKLTATNSLSNAVSASATLTAAANTLIAAATDLLASQQAADTASGVLADANAKVTAFGAQVVRYDALIADRVVLIPQLTAQIESLEAQILTETDLTVRANLTTQVNRARGDLALVNDAATLQAERDKAEAGRAAAVIDANNAQSALTTANNAIADARSRYQSAYNVLIGAGYLIPVYVLVGSGGDFGGSQPNKDSKFSLPKRFERELAVRQAALSSVTDRVVQARKNVTALQSQISSPPPCNITGTGVDPWKPLTAQNQLLNVDAKGGTR